MTPTHRTCLAPMTPASYDRFLAASLADYARDKVQSGEWAEAEAMDKSRAEMDSLLPQGLATPDHHLYDIIDGDTPDGPVVGMLWFARLVRGGQPRAFVYDVIVDPGHESQGHATRAFAWLETEVRRLGMTGIGLHVFGHNSRARALYERLGYQATNIHMFKPLTDPPAEMAQDAMPSDAAGPEAR